MASSPLGHVVVDLGGTHVRFARFEMCPNQASGKLHTLWTAKVNDFSSFSEALAAYLVRPLEQDNVQQTHSQLIGSQLSLSVAGPAEADLIALTNLNWQFSLQALQVEFGFDRVVTMNDFKAIAAALPALKDQYLQCWQSGQTNSSAARLVLGPGTGLGLGVLHANGMACPTEGGNVGFAPQTLLQEQLMVWARRHLGERVYVEQWLSGPGLVNLGRALADIEGEATALWQTPEQCVAAMIDAEPTALRVLDIFAELLGGYAGDMALAHGARGGVYLAGGLMGRFESIFPREVFLAAMGDKGRYQSYCAPLPVYLCQHPQPGLLGAGLSASQ